MNNFARPGLGATELPPVNADDNGKVLGVSDGAWAKVAASGGSDLPDDPAQDGTYNLQNTVSSGTGTLSWASGGAGGGVLVVDKEEGTFNKTNAEVYAAFQNGIVLVKDVDNNSPILILLLCAEKEDTNYVFSARFVNDIFYRGTGDNGYAVEEE